MKSQLWGSKVCAALRRAQKWVAAALGAAAFFAVGTASAASVAKVGDAEYETLEAALAAVQDGGTITLVDDVTVDTAIIAYNGSTMASCPTVASYTLDLNGKTLYASAEVNLNMGNDAQTVTVKNGKFHATGYSGRFRANDKATVTIENVAFTTDGYTPTAGMLAGVTQGTCVFQGYGKSENAYTFKDCTFTDCYVSIEGEGSTEPSNDVDFINCRFKLTGEKYIENAVTVNYYVAGALDFSGCTFDVKNFAKNSSTVRSVTVIDCDSTAASGLSITLDDTTVTGTTNEKGGSVSLIDVAGKSTTTVALTGTTSVTVDGTKVESPVSGIVAMVGDTQYFTLADALNAAVAANGDCTVEIVDDITFAEGASWETIAIGKNKTLVINGNGKTITGLPQCLFGAMGDSQYGSKFTMTNLKFVKPKASCFAATVKSAAGVILGVAYGMDVTIGNVVIEGADVRGGNDSYVAGFIGWCNGMPGGLSPELAKKTVTLRNCAIRNSTLVSCGSVGGLVAYTTATPNEAVTLVVENCEVTGNTIVGTEIKDGKPRTDIVGAVVGTVGAGGASVAAKVTGNTVYGSTSEFDAETLTKDAEVTTIYGRNASGGTLTLTGGTYDYRPFAETDSSWAAVAEGCALAGNDEDGWKVESFIKANGVAYSTLEAAFAAAEPDADGVVTYEIGGKATVDGEGWVQILKSGLTGVKEVKFVGTSDDAEICLVTKGSILADQSYDVNVSFEGLTLTRQNPEYVNDIGFGACYFSTWLRNVNAAENSVTYTRCKFPNGVCNNQYGKTFFNDCTFCNEASGGTTGNNLWVYDGEVEVNGGTFTGNRGVKVYNEGDAKDGISVKIAGATFDGLTEKSAILVSKPSAVTVSDVTVKDCAKGLITRDISGDDEAAVSANGTGISGTFAISSDASAAAAKKEFNLTGGTFTAAVDADYCAKGYEVTANDDGTYGVTSHTVAKVGDNEFNSLAEALKFALNANDGVNFTTVEIVDDITFDEGDTWEPGAFVKVLNKIEVKGVGERKTITGMPGPLFANFDVTGVDPFGSSIRVSNIKFVNTKISETAQGGDEKYGFGSVILGYAYGFKELTVEGVEIENADVRVHGSGDDSCYAAGFFAWCSGDDDGGIEEITIRNCAIRNSTIVSYGTAGGVIGYMSNSSYVKVTIENVEVNGNTIVGTEIKNGAPRTDVIGSVIGSVAPGGASVFATVKDNSVYGTLSAIDAETLTKDTDEVTTIYGRGVGSATLLITGGEYDNAPFAEADASWAKVAEWSKIVEQDGVYKVVDSPVTLGNVAARQRYPWNGLVDVTFELKSNKSVRLFIVAEYANGDETVRLPMAAAKLVNEDGTQSDVNVSDGSFTVAAQETAKTIHVVWDSTSAVPARQSGVTFKVYAK